MKNQPMKLVPFEARHIERIKLQGVQEYFRAYLTPEVTKAMEGDMAWTGLAGDVILGCAGILPEWEGRATAWALLSDAIAPHRFRTVHCWARDGLNDAQARGYRRIETTIDPTHSAAIRWATALGFEFEGLMKSYSPEGRDMYLVARVRQ